MSEDGAQRAEDVFRLLSDETRLDILQTVARAQHDGERAPTTELSFSDLYERVAVDSTSKLSYHLSELTGTFLRKHETGYAFTHAGEQLTRFVLARNYRQPPAIEPIEVDAPCLHCSETGLMAMCQEQYFVLQCPACERPNFSYKITPALVEAHDETTLLDAVRGEMVGDILKLRQGVCPSCGGRATTEVIDTCDDSSGERSFGSHGTCSVCEQCLLMMSIPLPHAVAYHPESVAFHWNHGVDIMEAGPWEFHSYLRDGTWTATRTETEPDEYRVEMRAGASSLRLYLDEAAIVTRSERVQRQEQSDRRIG